MVSNRALTSNFHTVQRFEPSVEVKVKYQGRILKKNGLYGDICDS